MAIQDGAALVHAANTPILSCYRTHLLAFHTRKHLLKFNIKRLIGTSTVVAAIVAAGALYMAPDARGSDHQDSNAMINRPSADITDVFMFPSKNAATPNNVVIAMDTHPLIPHGMGSSTFFDPGVMYQFKVVHSNAAYTPGAANGSPEDTVIQFAVTGSDSNQTLTMYGPAKPNETGQNSTYVTSAVASTPIKYNTPTTLNIKGPDGNTYPVQVYAGPRTDPFYFDLAQFFKVVPDRYAAYHATGASVPAASATSFRGFTAAFNAANNSACDTTPAHDFLTSGGSDLVAAPAGSFNVLSIVVEMPKQLLQEIPSSTGVSTATQPFVHLWASTSTTTGS